MGELLAWCGAIRVMTAGPSRRVLRSVWIVRARDLPPRLSLGEAVEKFLTEAVGTDAHHERCSIVVVLDETDAVVQREWEAAMVDALRSPFAEGPWRERLIFYTATGQAHVVAGYGGRCWRRALPPREDLAHAPCSAIRLALTLSPFVLDAEAPAAAGHHPTGVLAISFWRDEPDEDDLRAILTFCLLHGVLVGSSYAMGRGGGLILRPRRDHRERAHVIDGELLAKALHGAGLAPTSVFLLQWLWSRRDWHQPGQGARAMSDEWESLHDLLERQPLTERSTKVATAAGGLDGETFRVATVDLLERLRLGSAAAGGTTPTSVEEEDRTVVMDKFREPTGRLQRERLAHWRRALATSVCARDWLLYGPRLRMPEQPEALWALEAEITDHLVGMHGSTGVPPPSSRAPLIQRFRWAAPT